MYILDRGYLVNSHSLVISFHCDICGADLGICDVVTLGLLGLAVLSIEPHSGLLGTHDPAFGIKDSVCLKVLGIN